MTQLRLRGPVLQILAQPLLPIAGIPILSVLETKARSMEHVFSAMPQRTGSNEQSVARLEALGRLMDGAFVIPGTNIRMGLDGLIGLLPGSR